MSRPMKWIVASAIGVATLGYSMGISPTPAAADDARLTVRPAVIQTTGVQQVSVQPVNWRNGWGRPAVGVGVYGGGWGPSVYVGPRVAPRYYYGPRYYPPRYYGGYYQPYPVYGNAYPGYGVAYPGYGYYW